MNTAKLMCPEAWNESFSAGPTFASDRRLKGASLRRWRNTASEMDKPAIDHHCLVMHLGGPKRLHRTGDAYKWITCGPIDFAHLYFTPRSFQQCVREVFDREPATVELVDGVGFHDQLLGALMASMMDELAAGDGSGLYLQGLLDAAVARVVRVHSTLCAATPLAKQVLAPYKLRVVRDFIEEHLAQELELDMLAQTAGLSRFHFSRVFQQATGHSPFRYVTLRRLDRAKRLMCETRLSLAEIARQSGFGSAAYFSNIFRKSVGFSPSEWRRQR